MLTTKALVGIAHFLMQTDPGTAEQMLNQLSAEDSQQVIQFVQNEDNNQLPDAFLEKVSTEGLQVASPSRETSSGN